jgi:hypothetical protein
MLKPRVFGEVGHRLPFIGAAINTKLFVFVMIDSRGLVAIAPGDSCS